ncbi:MAG: hypothetical protein ACO3RV_02675 [Luteolibacter sp.]
MPYTTTQNRIVPALVLAAALSIGMLCRAETASPLQVEVNGKPQATVTLQDISHFNPKLVQLSRYGGRMDRKEDASGYFYAKQTDKGWILVDPDGFHYLSIGVCSVSAYEEIADHKDAFHQQFAGRADWAKQTHNLLAMEMGYNSLGCWSDWNAFKQAGLEIPYVRRWNLLASYAKKKGRTYKKYGHTGFVNDVLPVFDKAFAEHCDEVCKSMAETRNDPWLIGHFTDNELPFKADNILKRYLLSPAGETSHMAAQKFLKERNITQDSITRKDDTEFARRVMRSYYQTVHDAIRRHDPNHMILGSRLHGRASAQDICYTASGPFVDVVSINYYHRWSPNHAELDRRAWLAGKPILITEFYAKGADSGLDNRKGAGFTVATQKDRGRFYENYTLGLLKNRNIVGWHWFRYIDDGDAKTKRHSSNKGIVDIYYQPHKELVNSMTAINQAVYPLSDHLRPRARCPEPRSTEDGKISPDR